MVYVMVYVSQTYTMPETLCTSAFQPSNGIWYIYSHNHAKKPGHRFARTKRHTWSD